jgi:hypothetical protein
VANNHYAGFGPAKSNAFIQMRKMKEAVRGKGTIEFFWSDYKAFFFALE